MTCLPHRAVTLAHISAMRPTVRVILAFLAALMLFTSLGVASVAHAAEPIGCMDMSASATAAGHVDCGMAEVPSDAEKGYPHHHGACHGHQIAATADGTLLDQPNRVPDLVRAGHAAHLVPALVDPALKPPQA